MQRAVPILIAALAALATTATPALAQPRPLDESTLDAAAPASGDLYRETERPKLAARFSSRGGQYFGRGDYALAIADFSRAIELEPTVAIYYRNRASARRAAGQPAPLALADFNESLRLDPSDAYALVQRGRLRMELGDDAQARADFEAAVQAAPLSADPRLDIANLYAEADRYEAAIAYFEQWLGAHPLHDQIGPALNNRCWLRARLGRELDQALADCQAAMTRWSATSPLDSRGLVLLKLGRYDDAIADYDAVLKARPKAAWTLYARGVAKRRKGLAAEGGADIAAALALDPAVKDQARRAGLDG